MGYDDRDAKEIAIDAHAIATAASHRADAAANHALDAHGALGKVAGDMGRMSGSVDALKLAMIDGFRDLGVKMKTHRGKLDSLTDEWEDTKVTNLRKELRTHKARWKWILGVASTVLAAVIVAIIVHAFWH